MRSFIFLDNCGLLSTMPAFTQNRDEVMFFAIGKQKIDCEYLPEGVRYSSLNDAESLSELNITPKDRVVIHSLNPLRRRTTYEKIRAVSENVPILIVDPSGDEPGKKLQNSFNDPCLSFISVNTLLRLKSHEKWHQIEIKRKLKKLKRVVEPDKPLLILTQHDPDPDAIASAMALQTILGRNDKTAPIVTFKRVSRNENINMINIIGATVKQVSLPTVERAAQIAMVDVQPPFFKRLFSNVKIVIDHHPITEDYKVLFKDLQVTYGATSTIFTEYLLAIDMVIPRTLATALFYGIKTDTFLLGREVSKADFNAFVNLWPRANLQQIARMERPRLKAEELDVYIKALKKHEIKNGFLFAGLGQVPKEDLVPRLADFVQQIGKTDFAVVWGMVGRESTFSARSQTQRVHAGKVMSTVFAEIGSAGGHQSMARATMPTSKLFKQFKVRSVKKLSEIIRNQLFKAIKKQKSAYSTRNR